MKEKRIVSVKGWKRTSADDCKSNFSFIFGHNLFFHLTANEGLLIFSFFIVTCRAAFSFFFKPGWLVTIKEKMFAGLQLADSFPFPLWAKRKKERKRMKVFILRWWSSITFIHSFLSFSSSSSLFSKGKGKPSASSLLF